MLPQTTMFEAGSSSPPANLMLRIPPLVPLLAGVQAWLVESAQGGAASRRAGGVGEVDKHMLCSLQRLVTEPPAKPDDVTTAVPLASVLARDVTRGKGWGPFGAEKFDSSWRCS